MINSGKLILKGWKKMTDDIMKKVESLLFDEDEVPEEPEKHKELEEEADKTEEPEEVEEAIETPKGKQKKEPLRKGTSMVEIFFDGIMEIQGMKIKIVPGGEVESGNLRFVFDENSVKIYEI